MHPERLSAQVQPSQRIPRSHSVIPDPDGGFRGLSPVLRRRMESRLRGDDDHP